MPPIPAATLNRTLEYLRVLEQLEQRGRVSVSSSELALAAGSTAAQVRKDLASLGRFGRRGQGYAVALLKRELLRVMGLNRVLHLVLVGMGPLGHVLADAIELSEHHFQIAGLFATEPQQLGQKRRQLEVQPLDQLPELARRFREQGQPISLGIITATSVELQPLANVLVKADIPGILNFAPVALQPADLRPLAPAAPPFIENIDLTAGIKKLTYQLLSQSAEPHQLEETL